MAKLFQCVSYFETSDLLVLKNSLRFLKNPKSSPLFLKILFVISTYWGRTSILGLKISLHTGCMEPGSNARRKRRIGARGAQASSKQERSSCSIVLASECLISFSAGMHKTGFCSKQFTGLCPSVPSRSHITK